MDRLVAITVSLNVVNSSLSLAVDNALDAI
jgi:hypothetical protein